MITHKSWDPEKDTYGVLDPISLLRSVSLEGTHPWELNEMPDKFLGLAVGKGRLPKKHSKRQQDEITKKWDLDKKWFTD